MNRRTLIWKAVSSMFVLLTLAACGISKPQSPSSPGATASSITYGYAHPPKKGAEPVVIVSPEDGLKISMHDITFQQVNNIWVPGGYQLTITSASGKVTEIQFLDLKYGDLLALVGYSILENGKSIKGPSPESFDSASVSNGMGIYPDGDNPALFLALPCSISSSNKETSQEKSPQDIWMTHISKHTVTCASGETYVFDYGSYSYMDKPWLTMSGVILTLSINK